MSAKCLLAASVKSYDLFRADVLIFRLVMVGEALVKELQKLIYRRESLAPSRVDFFDATLELTANRLGFWSETEYEGTFHGSCNSRRNGATEACSLGVLLVESGPGPPSLYAIRFPPGSRGLYLKTGGVGPIGYDRSA